ncbi:MAG: hypothetical protein ABI837_08430 [Acidobacteriota bacterium]
MKIRRMIAALALVTLSLAAFSVYANHAWSTYHWARTANPFTLKVGNNMSSGWQAPLGTAISDWNASSVMNLTSVAGTSNKRCSAVAGTVQVCDGRYGNNGWLGLATISLTNGHISQGTAKMNNTYFDTATYNNPNEKLHVVCQEVGHTFGLDHQSTNGSSLNTCMDYFSNTGANAGSTLSTHPNQHDYDELVTIYTHLDSFTTIGAAANAPAAMANPTGDDPSEWGKLVSSEGRSEIYELDFGNGNKNITHVLWADDSHGHGNGN